MLPSATSIRSRPLHIWKAAYPTISAYFGMLTEVSLSQYSKA